MTTFLTFTILGLVLGSVYAIAASGLVLTYNTSGIFNFAHGAQAMIGAFLYYQLHSVWGLPTLLSVLIVLGLAGPALGFVLYTVIMKGLRDTAEVTKIVVTVAVLLGMVAFSHWFWDPQEPRISEMFFGAQAKIELGGVVIRYHELLCIIAAIGLAVGLRLLFTRVRLGVLMRAAVDDPDLLRLNGHDPDRLAATSWALGSVLAVLAGVLIVPVGGGGLEANSLTLLVIDAFAAALFGRLRSIPRTFLGAMVLGLAGTYLIAYAPASWDWAPNLRVALPMIILFVVLLVLPQDRLRGDQVRTRERYQVPTVRKAAVWAVLFVGIVVAIGQLIDEGSMGPMAIGLSFAIIALSLTLLTGYAGQINLAPVSLGAISSIVAYHFGIEGTGLDARMSLSGVLLGVLAAAAVGALIALPALRLRGLYLALATMAFGVLVSTLVLRDTQVRERFGHEFALFPNGNLIMPSLRVGPVDLNDAFTQMVVISVLFAVIAVGVVALRNSGYGRRLAAMKDSPAAAAMLGQRLVLLKLGVFTISSAIAGLGGVLMSMALTSVASEHFLIMVSLSLVMLTVVGGSGYVSGALFGGMMSGVAFTATADAFNDLSIDHPAYAGTFDILTNLILVSAALVGIGVGHNPSGLVHDLFGSYRRIAGARPVLVGAVAAQVVLYLLALADVLGTWSFSLLSMLMWLMLPAIARRLMPDVVLTAQERAGRDVVPPELVGIDTPYPAELARDLDRRLGLPAIAHRPAAAATTRTSVVPPAEETSHVPA